MIFHVGSNFNVRVLDPPTHLLQFDTNCGKIRYVVSDSKTNRSSFCLISKLSHALAEKVGLRKLTSWMLCSVYYLGCMVVNINALFAEWSITNVTTIRYCCLEFFLAWNALFIYRYRCFDDHFSDFGKYRFPQLQTCFALVLSADCTESSCSSSIVIFHNFLVFNFPFFNFKQ